MDRDMIKKFFVRFHRNILITRRQIDASSARDAPRRPGSAAAASDLASVDDDDAMR